MIEVVDAVIIGGGIAGASTAYWLARQGMRNVLVLERSAVAVGASGRASGFVGFLQAESPEQAAVLKASSDFYQCWNDEIGNAPSMERVGALALIPFGAADASARRQVQLMQAAGHVVREVGLDALPQGWSAEGVARVVYSADSGFIDPPAVTTAVMNRARSLGVRVYQGADVFGFLLQDNRVHGVRSNRGDVAAPVVILAAGAWSARLARLASVELPIWPVRHQVMHLQPPPEVRWPFPACGDPGNSLYFRPEAGGLVLAANAGPDNYPGEPPGDPERFDSSVSSWYGDWILRRIARRIPRMARAVAVGGHAGVYPKGPDGVPVLGETAVQGLYCICDTDGSGMTTSPGLGRALAEFIIRGSTFTDIRAFSPCRFGEQLTGNTQLPAYAAVGWDE